MLQGDAALLLVNAGADIHAKNQEGQEPMDLAPDKNVRLFLEKALLL
jgi:hypothetical protein